MSNQPQDALVVSEPTQMEKKAFLELSIDEQLKNLVVIAGKLGDFIEKNNLSVSFGKGKHIRYEGWNFVGNFLGYIPEEEYVKKIDEDTFEAKVVLKNAVSGKKLTSFTHTCSRNDTNWRGKDDYQVRSMAVTRAAAKAHRMPFSYIVKEAGYEPTPAEEMEGVEPTFSYWGALDLLGHIHDTKLKKEIHIFMIENRFDEAKMQKAMVRINQIIRETK